MNQTMCNKVKFDNWWDAQTRLNEINPNKESDKPQRMYKCLDCNKWHLTKISADDNNQRSQKIAEKVKKREECFINKEVEFYSKKFKL